MKSIYWPGLVFLLMHVGAASISAQYTPAQIKTLDSALTVMHNQGSFNGAVLVAENGKVLYKKAIGVVGPDTPTPLTTNAAFNLASVSKQFVAMMIMMLQEKGKLQFDNKVQRYLPELPYPNITIRHLLTHTSGLPEYFDLAFRYNNTLDTLTNNKLIRLLATYKPDVDFEPGAKWTYCNTNYVLLASIVEKASGMPVEDFFKQQITTPLGLHYTYVYCLRMKTSPPDRVFGFERQNGANVLNDLIRLDGVVGGGNIYSSVEDLLKWDQALYTEKLVHAKTWQEAITPVKLNDGSTYPYGFGWKIANGGKLLFHSGSWVGFHNFIQRNTETKQTLIVLSSSTGPTGFVKSILEGKPAELPQFQLISNVRLIDGTGSAARLTSVRLKNDKIWETGDLKPFEGEAITDGKGLTLAPGFIDSHSHHFGGLQAHPEATATLSQGITTIVVGQDGVSLPIDTIRQLMEKRPLAVNVATYTGQSTVRAAVLGDRDLFRTARPEEIAKMKTILQAEMDKGSLGVSTGLEYEEAFFSNREEVIELAKTAAASGGRYISHIRSEDINQDEAIYEIIEIGKQAKIPVQISHIKIAKRAHWGQAPDLLAKLQQARAAGVDITADCYPYDFWSSTMRVLFPNRDYTSLASAELAVTQLCDPSQSIVTRFAPNPEYAGKTLSDIAAIRRESPARTLINLVAMAADFERKNPDFSGGIESIMGKSMAEPDVAAFLAWPYTNICSDGKWSGHPRGFGAFTRVLGRYVREKKIMSLETAVYKMTGLAAEHLGLTERGLILAGNYADLVLFDPATVQDNADIHDATALSSGIEKVWVNGKLVFQSQRSTGNFPGRFIKRTDE